MRTATWTMVALSVPCIANVALWFILFAHPRLGFREDLKGPFGAGFFAGVGCAAAGATVVMASSKARTKWGFLGFFAAVILLNVYGFLWSIGAVVNAFS